MEAFAYDESYIRRNTVTSPFPFISTGSGIYFFEKSHKYDVMDLITILYNRMNIRALAALKEVP